MQKYGIALLAGTLLVGAAAGTMAQELASAVPAPKGEFMVFTEKGSHALSPTAISTIRTAVSEARTARQVTLIGRPENVAAVKSELVRQGVPADAIVARNDVAPLPKVGDGLSDPSDRRVEIKL
jgi:hypothetical protein